MGYDKLQMDKKNKRGLIQTREYLIVNLKYTTYFSQLIIKKNVKLLFTQKVKQSIYKKNDITQLYELRRYVKRS